MFETIAVIALLGYFGYKRFQSPEVPVKASATGPTPTPAPTPSARAPIPNAVPVGAGSPVTSPNQGTFVQRPHAVVVATYAIAAAKVAAAKSIKLSFSKSWQFIVQNLKNPNLPPAARAFWMAQTAENPDFSDGAPGSVAMGWSTAPFKSVAATSALIDQAQTALANPATDSFMVPWWKGVLHGTLNQETLAQANNFIAGAIVDKDWRNAFFHKGVKALLQNGKQENSTAFIAAYVRAERKSPKYDLTDPGTTYWHDRALTNADFAHGMPGNVALAQAGVPGWGE